VGDQGGAGGGGRCTTVIETKTVKALLTGLGRGNARHAGNQHAVIAQYLDELVAEGGDVLLDLIQVIFCHATLHAVLRLLAHVPPHQALNYCLHAPDIVFI
jgi:hypothetical protein